MRGAARHRRRPRRSHAWNAVLVKDCSGDAFAGDRAAPVRPGVWIRGRRNLDAIIAYLQLTRSLNATDAVVLGGGGTGGLAVLYAADRVLARVPPRVRFTALVDAGFMLDHATVRGTHDFRTRIIAADALLWNITGGGGTDADCLFVYPDETRWQCLFAPYLAPFVSARIFLLNALYDPVQLRDILELPCVPPQCGATDLQLAIAYGRSLSDALTPWLARSAERAGLFVDACAVHQQSLTNCTTTGGASNCRGWQAYAVDGRTPQQAFGAWYFGRDVRRRLDPVDGPTMNPTCARVGRWAVALSAGTDSARR